MKVGFHLLILAVILFAFDGNAQVLKFKTTAVAFKHKDENNNWQEWTEWEDASILITIDSESDRIIIYSKTKHTLDIAEI